MCGIFGCIKGLKPSHDDAKTVAHNGLKRLVYRGYDSWGIATFDGVIHETGEVTTLEDVDDLVLGEEADAAISHTRWATHGDVTEDNAHPHSGCSTRFEVVHNGVIENHEELKQKLVKENHGFESETDSEVIPHFIEDQVQKGRTVPEAINVFDEEAEGNYSFVLLDRKQNQLYGFKKGSPLVFAIPNEEAANSEGNSMPAPKEAFFSSDLYAISDKTEEAFFMEDGDLVMTSGGNYCVWRNGEITDSPTNHLFEEFEWTEEEPVLGEHSYWMEKEIKEQPKAMKQLGQSLKSDQAATLEKFKEDIQKYDQVIFTGSGTSYHSTLLGVYYLNQTGVNAQTLIASEFENYERITENTLVIAVSQSGETRDVLDAINYAQERDATVHSIVNVPYSSIERKTEETLRIHAGQEICVAATKTFANQVYTMMHLANKNNLEEIPFELEERMDNLEELARLEAKNLEDTEDYYIIGENSTYPLAREIALKLKEISYVHAEGMMAGELKHGTLALIEEDTPVLALDSGDGHMETTIEEVTSRGGEVSHMVKEYREETMVFAATTYGFFLALEWAKIKDLPVDKPRNLAKSVTVK